MASTVLFCLVVAGASLAVAPAAAAQDVGAIVNQLERDGYYIEPGGEGSDARFGDLVRQGDRADDNWYFVSMADTVPDDFADDLFERVSPGGNVLVYFLDSSGFVNVQLASGESESIETRALAPFDEDWNQPEDFMSDVITEFDRLTVSSSTTSGTNTSGSTGSSDSSGGGGGGFLLFLAIAVLGIGGIWFVSSRGKKKKQAAEDLETAQKIRAELQSELDELANDVLVLSNPVDVSDNPEATNYYREATDTYLTISDELPDVEKLEEADLQELSELGARVAHARWQMDAAEAVMAGEPVPEPPKVAPPPAPPAPPRREQRRQLPQRQPRPRVQYSQSRRRSGGGLLDVLIAGAGMMGTRGRSRGRSGGGMFGGGRSSRGRSGGGMFGGSSRRQSTPRSGGGVFGGRSGSRSTSRSTSRSSNRRSGSGRSTSKRRRRSSRGRVS